MINAVARPGSTADLSLGIHLRVALLEWAKQERSMLLRCDYVEGRAVDDGEARRNRLIKPAELVCLLGGQLTGGTAGRP